jgi:hypothetical protein
MQPFDAFARTLTFVVSACSLLYSGWLMIELRAARQELRVIRRLSRARAYALAREREAAAEMRGRLRATDKAPRTAPRAPTRLVTPTNRSGV